MNKLTLKIGFIGAGAIGSLFGGYIAGIESDVYKIDVIFFCRRAHAEEVNENGLKIYRNQEVKVVKTIQANKDEKYVENKLLKDSTFGFDFIFLTTKAHDSEKAIMQYKKLIDASKWLVILQNGIGNEDLVVQHFSKSKIIRALTTNGAILKGPGQLIHTGEGITKIGFPFIDDLELEVKELEKIELDLKILKDLLGLAGLKTMIVKDIIKECWEKVFINVGINAFGALTRLRNGQLLERERLMHFMGEAITEAIKVAEMKKIKLNEKDYVSLANEVAKKTAKNKNSMLQDILNGKPTEIDFINGRILKYARDLGIKVPINELLTHLIKGLEYSSI